MIHVEIQKRFLRWLCKALPDGERLKRMKEMVSSQNSPYTDKVYLYVDKDGEPIVMYATDGRCCHMLPMNAHWKKRWAESRKEKTGITFGFSQKFLEKGLLINKGTDTIKNETANLLLQLNKIDPKTPAAWECKLAQSFESEKIEFEAFPDKDRFFPVGVNLAPDLDKYVSCYRGWLRDWEVLSRISMAASYGRLVQTSRFRIQCHDHVTIDANAINPADKVVANRIEASTITLLSEDIMRAIPEMHHRMVRESTDINVLADSDDCPAVIQFITIGMPGITDVAPAFAIIMVPKLMAQ